ncbi:MAG: alcohol dehydrogenase catalytic domain-containing protein [Gammaproteobacteria bacterium]|nr:alcohol dehydrogenase catalytic domain-containing protein [Gammaproteobacteria bacterium]
MKTIRIIDGQPQYLKEELGNSAGVRVKIRSSSICGSDLHMIQQGWAEGRVLGHEFAGTTDDGTAVTVEPNLGCGRCQHCREGYRSHCDEGAQFIGVDLDGGMAEYALVPEAALFPLPTGIDLSSASLMEPLAVAAHGLNRARVTDSDKVLIIGAGSIGLAAAAILCGRGMPFDMTARYDHQKAAAEQLGGNLQAGRGYDVVLDAVGTTDSIKESISRCRPMGRIAFVGTLWNPATLGLAFCAREVELIAATTYRVGHSDGEFHEAGKLLAAKPHIAAVLISHRFPLEAAVEAFATARDRAAGAIKVVFDV